MRARKVDANQSALVLAFKKMGCSVEDLSRVGGGCPDLLLGRRGKNLLVEIKDGSKSPSACRLNPLQEAWHSDWNGRVEVVKSLSDAIYVVENCLTRKE